MNEHNEKKAYIPPTMEVLKMDCTKVLMNSCPEGFQKSADQQCISDADFE